MTTKKKKSETSVAREQRSIQCFLTMLLTLFPSMRTFSIAIGGVRHEVNPASALLGITLHSCRSPSPKRKTQNRVTEEAYGTAVKNNDNDWRVLDYKMSKDFDALVPNSR